MIKNHLRFLVLLVFLFTNFLFAQQTNLWSRINDLRLSNTELQSKVKIKKYDSFELKVSSLRNALKNAPKRANFKGRSATKIDFPDENGKMETYLIKESAVMHPDLAKKYPENRSYVGVSEKNASKRIHFSMNELGLHAIIMDTKRGVRYIQPLTKDKKKYKVYSRKDIEGDRDFECFTENVETKLKSDLAFKNTNDGKLRTYRLALGGTGEYSQFHIADQDAEGASDTEKKAIVLAAMTTAITRVNAVYENDLAISLQLVANNEDIIYLDPNSDPYSNFDSSLIISENQTTCDAVIGSGNYDLGHVFATGIISVATLRSVCVAGLKARGATGYPYPKGDDFYFDYMAHELGHQFGANHTFNGDESTCGQAGQRNEETAVEPGSGSTLMAYAGICSSQNVQNNSDLYFHIVSIEEIRTFVLTGAGGNCAAVTDLKLNQNVPTADAGNDFVIPKGTPFKLVGAGSDADGDPITFGWEQIDNGITTVPPSETAVSGASYRSYDPNASNVRYLPHLNTLITGAVSSTWEVTPSVGRELNFRLTVRDNNSEAGQVISDDLKVTVSDEAGPFVVTSQNTEDIVWTAGTQETISWDVAGTNTNNINVSTVNILLSTDGGKTFSTSLATGVSNDGTQTITVPDTKASQCFVMVEAIGNFFLAMNTTSFSIGEFNEICNSYTAEDTPIAIPDNDVNGVSSSISVPTNGSIEYVKISLIDKSNPSFNSPGITHTYIGDLNITLESPQGTIIDLVSNACEAREDMEVEFSDDGDPLSCNLFDPGITGSKKPLQELSTFHGENAQGNWILKVVDGFDADTGFLEAWSLEICSSEPVLSVNNYVFDEFQVFPNPSDGYFNVKFRSEETSDVEILVYDLLGRKIVKKDYKNLSNNFDERIDLENVTGGIYILSVKRGNKMSSHKIRIK